MAALGVDQRRLPMDVPRAPRRQRPHYHPELLPLVGQDVLGPRRMVRVEPACHEPVLIHQLEPIREDVRWNSRQAPLEILEPPGAAQHVAYEQKRPAVADQVERLRDWTGLTIAFGHVLSVSQVLTEKLVAIK